jgi:hypothetical protein
MDQRERELVEAMLSDPMNGERRERLARTHAPDLLPSHAPEQMARQDCFRTRSGISCRCMFGGSCSD